MDSGDFSKIGARIEAGSVPERSSILQSTAIKKLLTAKYTKVSQRTQRTQRKSKDYAFDA
jgi:hypothetical protein